MGLVPSLVNGKNKFLPALRQELDLVISLPDPKYTKHSMCITSFTFISIPIPDDEATEANLREVALLA